MEDKDTQRIDSSPPDFIDMNTENDIDIVREKSEVHIISQEDKRKNLRLSIASKLGIILWSFFFVVIAYHCGSTLWFSYKLSSAKSEQESSYINEAIQVNHETAQSIYTFLTPMVVAVTAFFFDANRSYKDNEKL